MSDDSKKVMPLREKDRLFVEEYMRTGGNITAAGASVDIEKSTSHRMMSAPKIQKAIVERSQGDPLVADRMERQRWWTAIMRDPELELQLRMRASDMLAKSQGDYIIKIEAKVETIDPRVELSSKLDRIAARKPVAPS